MNAREHFDWAVQRATEYLDLNDAPNAMVSLVSDLGKHPGTATILHEDLQFLMFGEYMVAGTVGVRRFIDGLPAPVLDLPGDGS